MPAANRLFLLASCLRQQKQKSKADLANFVGSERAWVVRSALSLIGKALPQVLRIVGWLRQFVRTHATLHRKPLIETTAAFNQIDWPSAKPTRVRPK